MGTLILIYVCILIILAYLFDITSSKTRIPAIIILLALGIISKQVVQFMSIELPDLNSILPQLGTIGLILIVLDGSLELELESKKIKVIKSTLVMALFPMMLSIVFIAFIASRFFNSDFNLSFVNAIPIAIISSAIAIPTAKIFPDYEREFVIYESSISDIIGVILFNFFVYNEVIDWMAGWHFLIQIFISLAISFIATLMLSYLLGRLKHHVKFVPVMVFIILLYSVAKLFHLPALIMVLALGLFLANFQKISHYKWMKILKPDELENEVVKFREIVVEVTFIVRTTFFLLFGFLLNPSDLVNYDTLIPAVVFVALIFVIRFVFLMLLKQKIVPLLFIAPRGLITVLLFISLPQTKHLALFNNALIIQIVILTAVIMMMGTIFSKSATALETQTG